MSSYSLSNSAPINNIGYYDAPVHNQYSNQDNNGSYRQITNNQFNHHVSDTYNSNDNYEIYQTQNYPSNNLFIENNTVQNGHGYTGNNGEYNGAIVNKPNHQRNIPHPSQIYAIENFENQNPDMEGQINANRLDKSKNLRERPIRNNFHQQHQQQPQQHQQQQQQQQQQNIIYNNNQNIPRQPSVQFNDYNYNKSPDYLNVGSIPNIAGLYNMNRPTEKIIIKEVTNDKETRITDLDSDDDIDDNDDNDDDDEKENKKQIKLSKLKKNIDKKKKMKKKKNKMIYMVIFLLIIIIGLMLYIVMGNKVKRVRF
jgi:hypothetical protein